MLILKRLYFLVIILFISLGSANAIANHNTNLNPQNPNPDYLESAYQTKFSTQSPDSVFKVFAKRINESQVEIKFNIKPNYYLYAKSLTIQSNPSNVLKIDTGSFPETIKIPQLNNPEKLDDVYIGDFNIMAHVDTSVSYPKLLLIVTIQGCDGKTICYPPEVLSFDITSIGKNMQIVHNEDITVMGTFNALLHGELSLNKLINSLSMLHILLIFFLAGFAISLTPCMYPLYPIALASILGRGNRPNIRRVLVLVLSYIHGISLVYILIGFLVSTGGVLLTTAMQTPLFIICGSIIWLILGLIMLDLVKFNLPNGFNNYLYSKNVVLTGGNIPSVVIMGILSALLLGPCVTPPLIAALSIIVIAHNVLLGVGLLYAISLGMGIPILMIALFGNKIMPKSGSWMNIVKYILGILIIVVSVYLVLPLLVSYNIYLSLSILSLGIGLLMLKLTWNHPKATFYFQKRLAIFIIILACVFQIIAIQDKFWQKPIDNINSEFITATKSSELNYLIKTSNKPVIIDFYASWCSICREMASTTFKDPKVINKLSNYTVIKFDLSQNTSEAQMVLKHYGLYGIPALIILWPNQKPEKLVGYISSMELLNTLDIIKIQHN